MKKTTIILRKRDLKKEKQKKLLSICGLLSALILATVILAAVIPSKASEDSARIKYYASVEICDGDSLYSIADEYITDEYADKAAYIRELCSINHLTSDTTIHSGQYLIVPYFTDIQ